MHTITASIAVHAMSSAASISVSKLESFLLDADKALLKLGKARQRTEINASKPSSCNNYGHRYGYCSGVPHPLALLSISSHEMRKVQHKDPRLWFMLTYVETFHRRISQCSSSKLQVLFLHTVPASSSGSTLYQACGSHRQWQAVDTDTCVIEIPVTSTRVSEDL